MATIREIEELTKGFADCRDALIDARGEFLAEQSRLQRRYFPRLRRLAVKLKEAHAALIAAVEASPHQFEQPRTVIFHGVKVGFRKGTGKIEWESDTQVVKLIRRHFADQFDLLVKTTEKPIKGTLKELASSDLKKLGVTVESTSDVPVVKPIDTEVDKALRAFLGELPEEDEVDDAEEAAA